MSEPSKFKKLMTIAIPTYNGAATIGNLLDLLLPQCTEEIEVIISDNNSTDGTELLIEQYKKSFHFINYVRNDKNIGPDANYLQCMNMSKGQFIWLISDDDIIIENSLENIIAFLKKNSTISLAYVDTVDFRVKYTGVKNCTQHKPVTTESFITTDKKIFFKYAGRYWGFLSSFIISAEKFHKVENPENFFGTYWLQGYINSMCVAKGNSLLGIIHGPCLGAGIYINSFGYDTALVHGILFKKLLNFMSDECGFDKKQLEESYILKICLLGRHNIIKEKAAGLHLTNKELLFKCAWIYPRAWILLFPTFFVPEYICRITLRLYRKVKGASSKIKITRPNDVISELK
jgi:glycosyltransferase involved in cell wall biosynthesis